MIKVILDKLLRITLQSIEIQDKIEAVQTKILGIKVYLFLQI